MSVYYKQGVTGLCARPIRWAIGCVAQWLDRRGEDLLVTALVDGNHGYGTLHTLGFVPMLGETVAVCMAFDFNVTGTLHQTWENELREWLNEQVKLQKPHWRGHFDVAWEGNHMHVEWEPEI